ncbi:MAG: hypothetical protein HPY66_2957 [Firmicutes bacterium]|nr:hypothetical protein [Bacillota bacterium]
MTKLIVVESIRCGTGRTTVACLAAMQLAGAGERVLVIDNNFRYCDVERYFMVDAKYGTDDVKPFLASRSLTGDTLKGLCTVVSDNLYMLAGSRLDNHMDILGADDIETIKDAACGLFDYILLDGRAGLTCEENMGIAGAADKLVIVALPSRSEFAHFRRQLEGMDKKDAERLMEIIDEKGVLVLNRCDDSVSFDEGYVKEFSGRNRMIKLYYSPALVDFANGYRYRPDVRNGESLNRLTEAMAGRAVGQKTGRGPVSRLKAVRNIFN